MKQPTKCRSCGQDIIFLTTSTGKNIPVDYETYKGERQFEHNKHRSHFATCPEASKFRKKPWVS